MKFISTLSHWARQLRSPARLSSPSGGTLQHVHDALSATTRPMPSEPVTHGR